MKTALFIAIATGLILTGCGDNCNSPSQKKEPIPEMGRFDAKIVCSPEGMVYYEIVSNNVTTYTPVVVSYYTNNNPTTSQDAPFITCSKYMEMKQ